MPGAPNVLPYVGGGLNIALLPSLVLFQTYSVLTSYYEVPRHEAAAALRGLLAFRGLRVPDKSILRRCLDTLSERAVDLVDAYLAALCTARRLRGVRSFDASLGKLGIELLPVD